MAISLGGRRLFFNAAIFSRICGEGRNLPLAVILAVSVFVLVYKENRVVILIMVAAARVLEMKIS